METRVILMLLWLMMMGVADRGSGTITDRRFFYGFMSMREKRSQ